jgi:hypothetical protein
MATLHSMFHWRLLRNCYCFILILFSLRLFHYSFYYIHCFMFQLFPSARSDFPLTHSLSDLTGGGLLNLVSFIFIIAIFLTSLFRI